jgi:methionyl aminopeptidase
MSIQSPEELAGVQAIGRIVALTLQARARAVQPGITTAVEQGVERILFVHSLTTGKGVSKAGCS